MIKYVKISIATLLIAVLAITGCSQLESTEENETAEVTLSIPWKPMESTERSQRAQETYEQLFGDIALTMNETNPEYVDIMNNFIYGDIIDLLGSGHRLLDETSWVYKGSII